ncbi:MAG: Spx/MgsR family RNA polymerase-binding regulatory protein [Verrucomicrobiota bacterium]|nr:Spx/MgsR family RNA polymerase-binding regulatory protein [Verrucomicrobiota bacterium]
MPNKVYEYNGCSTCRKALKWLEQNEADYKSIPIRETPPSKAELRRMLKLYDGNIRKIFNTSGAEYKKLNLKDNLPKLTEAQLIDMLNTNGNLVKRPFLINKEGGRVGFMEQEWSDFFGL